MACFIYAKLNAHCFLLLMRQFGMKLTIDMSDNIQADPESKFHERD